MVRVECRLGGMTRNWCSEIVKEFVYDRDSKGHSGQEDSPAHV